MVIFVRMPNLGHFHPQIVHFVIALLVVGVGLRWVSLTGKLSFTNLAATTLILLGTVAAVLAVASGTAAHDVVERIPGVGGAVRIHEEWGERTRNLFLAISVMELAALAFMKRPALHKGLLVTSALAGLLGVYAVYEVGDKGGDLVYSYAGGPGLRTGDTADIGRLYVAGVYERAMLDRKAGKSDEAAALIEQLAQRQPEDTSMQLLRIESLFRDRKDPQAALAELRRFAPPKDNPRFRLRVDLLAADAYEAAGMKDSARAVLQRLVQDFPSFQRLRERLSQLGG
jgi:uncharacterized membrane protein